MIWPGFYRRQASRQLLAMYKWYEQLNTSIWNPSGDLEQKLNILRGGILACISLAEGYYKAGDWVGVESQYLRVHRLFDKFVLKNWSVE